MEDSKKAVFYLALAIVLFICKGTGLYKNPENEIHHIESDNPVYEPNTGSEPLDCFEYAEKTTGFSAEILRGIAATESRFRATAVGDKGMSLGMFQLHSAWYDSRAAKWGEYDPLDPFESAVIAGHIMRENLDAFSGDMNLAIAAYKQGVTGVRKNGPIQWYVTAVLNWRKDSEKVLSLFLFCGITESEESEDGDTGSGI
jgi:hypothetical protein